MFTCTFVVYQPTDSLAISSVGNTKEEALGFLNTDAIADYIFDLDTCCNPPYVLTQAQIDGICESRRNGNLDAMIKFLSSKNIPVQIFYNKF